MYTIGLHYYDVMVGLKDKDTALCSAVQSQKLQITKKSVGEKDLALSIQNFYMRLLRRTLSNKYGGGQDTLELIDRYNEALLKLREMRQILLAKSLLFWTVHTSAVFSLSMYNLLLSSFKMSVI